MKQTLDIYNAASRDVKLNSIPSRSDNNVYIWSDGQLQLMNQSRFYELRNNQVEIVHLNSMRKNHIAEMFAYEHPANNLGKNQNGFTDSYKEEIDELKEILKQSSEELRQFDDDMYNRGIYLKNTSVQSAEKVPVKERKKVSTAKKVFYFFGVWILCEVFMTAVQWNSLRYDRGINDMVIRSLSLGLILFLIEYVALINKSRRRRIYIIYLVFAFAMLFMMMFGQAILNEIYPENVARNISEQWSLANDQNSVNKTQVLKYPFWVEFYRSYEMLPAVMALIFFIAIKSFLHPKKKEAPGVEIANEPRIFIESAHDEMMGKRNHLVEKVRVYEVRLEKLQAKKTLSDIPDTKVLADILRRLENNKKEILAIDKKINTLGSSSEALLKILELDMQKYQTDYLDLLRNDPVKSQFVKPVWPTRNDILSYYKISTL